MADQTVDGARGLTADRWRRSSRLPWAAVLEPTRSSRAQRRVHGGAAVETKRSGLKIPNDELSSEIKNSAKIMIIYNIVLRYLGVTPALLRGKLDNDATSTDTAGHDSFRPIKASSTRLVAGKRHIPPHRSSSSAVGHHGITDYGVETSRSIRKCLCWSNLGEGRC